MKRDGLKVRQSVNHSFADLAISAPTTSSAAQPAYGHNFADVGVYQPQSAARMTVQRCACDGKKDEDDNTSTAKPLVVVRRYLRIPISRECWLEAESRSRVFAREHGAGLWL